MPDVSPLMVVLFPEPVVVPPGVLVNVQVPVAGKPLKTTLPVGTLHVGCVIVPTLGAVGGVGTASITTFPVATEVHPAASVTV